VGQTPFGRLPGRNLRCPLAGPGSGRLPAPVPRQDCGEAEDGLLAIRGLQLRLEAGNTPCPGSGPPGMGASGEDRALSRQRRKNFVDRK